MATLIRALTCSVTSLILQRVLTGISAAALSRWESGKMVPSVESFNKVMTALGAELLVIGN